MSNELTATERENFISECTLLRSRLMQLEAENQELKDEVEELEEKIRITKLNER